jgi:hypothetical protein
MKSTIFIALFAVGCGENMPQLNITKTIGSEGGTVNTSDGTQLNVPMGALSMSANITITPINATPPPGTVLVGPAYDFQPEGTQFAQPVTITLPYDPAKIPTGITNKDIVIYTAPRGSTTYQALFTSLATSGNTVTTQTTHLSTYLPAAPAAACTPVCTSTTDSCGCTASCMGNQQVIQCFGSTGTFSCFCELNHQTMSAPQVTSCSETNIKAAFNVCFAG